MPNALRRIAVEHPGERDALLVCVIWLLLGVPLAILHSIRPRLHRDGSSGADVSPVYWDLTGLPRDDLSTEALDQARAGWLGGLVNIWELFYGQEPESG